MWRRSPKVSFRDGGKTVILGQTSPRGSWLKNHPQIWASLPALFILIAIVVYGTWVKADSFEFYPVSCLGNWENVGNVLGDPEVGSNADITQFNRENSAHFPGGDAQIFCGNFSGNDSPEKIFKRATLTFRWAFIGGSAALPVSAPLDLPPLLAPPSSTLAPTSSAPSDPSSPLPAELLPTSSASSTSWLDSFLSTAFAQTTDSSSISAVPPEDPSLSSSTSASSTPGPSSTLSVPFDVGSPPVTFPSSPEPTNEDVFQVSFSLDGQQWINLGTVSPANWQNASFNLDIHSWEDLRNLQISIKGLNTPGLLPDIYLDGIKVTVEAQPQSILQSILAPPPPPPVVPPPPPIFDPASRHSCQILPFSNTVHAGEASRYLLVLKPSEPGRSYTTELGELPPGVTGEITPNPSSTADLFLDLRTNASTTLGSYSLIVVYRETESDGKILPNYCQYNLVVAP